MTEPASPATLPAGTHRGSGLTRDHMAAVVAAAFILVFTVLQALTVLDRQPMSVIDEHVHFDTALRIHNGELSHRGDLVSMDVVREWACGVGSQAGGLMRTCDDPELGPDELLSGKYTTGYIHYPTYFVGAEGFRQAVEAIAGPRNPLTTYRMFSMLMLSAGLVACGVVAHKLGLRGISLLAAVVVPAAASETVRMGVIFNPNSMTILFGALIAGTGLRWLQTGKGFAWLLAVTALASCIAVVASLPAGAVLLAAILAWVGARRGWRLAGGCTPGLKHIALLVAALVVPIIGWGRYVEATATASNAVVYEIFKITSVPGLIGTLGAEFTRLHSPWSESPDALTFGTSRLAITLREMGNGIPLWITILVIGGLVLTFCGAVSRRHPEPHTDETRRLVKVVDPCILLAGSAVAGVVLYPVALHLSNAITFGIDVFIVNRYSMGFAPMLVLLALLLIPHRRFTWLLVALGAFGTLALATSFA